MKNIGLLIPTIYSGGAERVATRFSFLLENDYNVYFILFDDSYMLYPYSGQLVNMGLGAKEGFLNKIFLVTKRSKKLKEIKKTYNLDYVFSFMDSPNLCNALSKSNGCKTILSVRNYEIDNYQGIKAKIMNCFYKWLYSKADLTVTVSEQLRIDLIDAYDIDPHKTYTIYNPYDINEIKLRKNREVNSEHRDFFKRHKDKKKFVTVGRNVHQKGFWHLIRAFAKVHETNPNTCLIIVGKDEKEGSIKALTEKFQLQDSILHTGFCDDPYRYVERADIYVMTSLYEGFPNALVEAMATGTPVIASDCKSGPREILMEEYNFNIEIKKALKCKYGIIVPKLSENEIWDCSPLEEGEYILAETMIMLAENEELLYKFGQSAKKRAAFFNYDSARDKLKYIMQ